MSAFDRLERIASRAVDRLNGDRFVLVPMRGNANQRRSRDPDRPAVTGVGVLDLRNIDVALQTGPRSSGGGNDFQTMARGEATQLSCATDIFTGKLPRQGDVVEMKGRRYDVVSARPDGMSRVVLVLEGGAP